MCETLESAFQSKCNTSRQIMHHFTLFTVWQSEDTSQRNQYKKGYRWNIFCKKGQIRLTILYSEPQTTEKRKRKSYSLL